MHELFPLSLHVHTSFHHPLRQPPPLSPPLPSQAAAALGIPATAVAVRGSDSGAVVSIDGRQLLDAQKQAKLAALVAALEAALPVGGVAGELGGNAVASAAMLTQGACLSSL